MNWTDLKITVSTKDAETAEAMRRWPSPTASTSRIIAICWSWCRKLPTLISSMRIFWPGSRTEAILHLYLPPEENPAEASAFLTHRLEAEGIPYRIETDQTLAEEDWAKPGSVFITPPTWVNGWWYAPAGRNTPPPRKNW